MELRTTTQFTVNKTPYILPLSALKRGDISLAGGKGANLGELASAGFPVPAGFVLTTAAYDRFVEQGRLGDAITRFSKEQPESGSAIRSAFENTLVPQEIEHAILESYRQLGGGPVAVRSSATAEDLPGSAFAGQQDTLLNITGDQPLVDAVRHCWASLWTDRAIVYRTRQGLDQADVKLAVVVQRMAAAEVAGVMFTANPVTGVRDEIVVDASPGLGEAVVSGLVTPDHSVLRKRRLGGYHIAGHTAGRGEVIVRAKAGGGTEHIEGTSAGVSPLPGPALQQLARLGERIQVHFGSPQDIEWAWDGRKLFILQARPITALPQPPLHPSRPVQMLAAMFVEMFPTRPYPLDQTTWVPALSTAAVEPIFSLLGVEVPSLGKLFNLEDEIVLQFTGKVAIRPTPKILLAPLRLLNLALRYDPLRWRDDPLRVEALARAQTLEARHLNELSWEDLLSIIRQALGLTLPLAGEIRRRYYPRSVVAIGLLQGLLVLLRRGKSLGALISGTDSFTSEANRRLEDLAERVRSDPDLSAIFAHHSPDDLAGALQAAPAGRSFMDDLRAFLDAYGHREVILSTALHPTWKDAPETVLGIIKGLAATGPRAVADRLEWEAARDELLALPVLKIPFFHSTFLRLLASARCLWQVRESTHYDATRILPILRRT
ncbi:MAG: PEP/pyruvate-binding domain-containing protein, partial [Omnitrophica WOR_2 bacterium]